MAKACNICCKKSPPWRKIDIVNCEKAVITGGKKSIFDDYKQKNERGTRPTKGPFTPKMPDRFVRRTIRGMLPYKQEKGEKAFKRIMCYIGIPDDFKDKKIEKIESCSVSKLGNLKYQDIDSICKSMKERK